jgi:hypothetical protein
VLPLMPPLLPLPVPVPLMRPVLPLVLPLLPLLPLVLLPLVLLYLLLLYLLLHLHTLLVLPLVLPLYLVLVRRSLYTVVSLWFLSQPWEAEHALRVPYLVPLVVPYPKLPKS